MGYLIWICCLILLLNFRAIWSCWSYSNWWLIQYLVLFIQLIFIRASDTKIHWGLLYFVNGCIHLRIYLSESRLIACCFCIGNLHRLNFLIWAFFKACVGGSITHVNIFCNFILNESPIVLKFRGGDSEVLSFLSIACIWWTISNFNLLYFLYLTIIIRSRCWLS